MEATGVRDLLLKGWKLSNEKLTSPSGKYQRELIVSSGGVISLGKREPTYLSVHPQPRESNKEGVMTIKEREEAINTLVHGAETRAKKLEGYDISHRFELMQAFKDLKNWAQRGERFLDSLY